MNGLLVSELARRSGVPTTTLRFYEEQGLLPAGRTPSGYRVYDDAAVDRLGFIATAKRLGLALPEIRLLLQPWQHGGCRDVQAELGPLLEARITETRERIAELTDFGKRLEAAREHLGLIDRDGPCDSSCTFLDEPSPAGLRLQSLPRPDQLAEGAGGQTPPIACSLETGQRGDRAERWHAVLEAVAARTVIEGGLRLEFEPQRVDVAELAGLAAAEAGCCAFLELTLRFGPVPVLEVRAPSEGFEVLMELFAEPAA